jgi:hypothetical protein
MTWQGLPKLSDMRMALIAFAASLFAYVGSGSVVLDSYDTTPNAYLPASLLIKGDLGFSPLQAPFMFVWAAEGRQGSVWVDVQRWNQLVPDTDMTVRTFYEHGFLQFKGPRYFVVPTKRERSGETLFVGTFGPMAGLTAVPVAAAAYAFGSDLSDPLAAYRAAKWTAALLSAGSVAFVFLTALAFTSRSRAFALALIYGLGTCVWALSSQALWQQTPELFFLSLGVLCMTRGDSGWTRSVAAGLAFSAAAACRPTAAIVGLAAGAYLFLADRRSALLYVLGALPVLIGLAAYNLYYFGASLDFGQLTAGAVVAKFKTGSEELWQTPVWLGAAGLLLSPSRGLLIYTPWLVLAFAGAYFAWKDERYARLRFLSIAVPALWLPAFVWFDWWGGWTYGYRPIVDSTPLLALLCVPAIDRVWDRPTWRVAFSVAVAWSVFVQILGVEAYTPWAWNAPTIDAKGTIANIDHPEYRERLWSFRDWQIGYLIVNFAEARSAKK